MFFEYSKHMLEEYGNETITDLKILKNPIQSYVFTLLNILSFGRISYLLQLIGYEHLYHTAVLINHTYLLDRWCCIRLRMFDGKLDNKQILSIPLPHLPKKTIREILEETRLYVGDKTFYSYHMAKNNCQDFVLQLLFANQYLKNKETLDFVKQYTYVANTTIPYPIDWFCHLCFRIFVGISNLSWKWFGKDLVHSV